METETRRVDLELAVQDVDGVRTAAAVGAARVELCAALGATGGITPSMGAVGLAVETGLPVHVLIRPRPGSFVYSPEELAVAEADTQSALRVGAAGVVIGALTDGGTIDRAAVERLVGTARDIAPDAEITFHRAIDTALHAGHEPAALLEQLAGPSVTRILTSGGSNDWGLGLPVLRTLVAASARLGSPLQIMAGGGVRLGVIPALLDAGADAIHVSAKHHVNPSGVSAAPGQGRPDHEATALGLAASIARALPLEAPAPGTLTRLPGAPPTV